MTTINTFAKLLGSYGVEIPLIQRDYVQGRVHDIREFQGKGDDLSKALLKKYTKEKSEFRIYSSKEKNNNKLR